MGWEKMSSDIKTCWCGKGTISYIMEMDDWRRFRSSKEIDCPECRENERIRCKKNIDKEESRKELYSKAKEIAKSRYLEQWLEMYEGRNKKEAWRIYTGGDGYPSLGTFYNHVKESGVIAYMRWCFNQRFEGALKIMGIEDPEINNLLNEINRI